MKILRSPIEPQTLARRRVVRGFTILEVLVSSVLLMMVLGVLLSLTTHTQKIWKSTRGALEQFRESRNGFETVSRTIRQATLNSYWDYEYPGGDTTKSPSSYQRQSELRFISGPATALGLASSAGHAAFFQAPTGKPANPAATLSLNKLLNTLGYFIELTDGLEDLPPFLAASAQARWRMRLYELIEPSENLTIYSQTSGDSSYTSRDWYTTPLATRANVRPIAENVVALIIRPISAVARKTGAIDEAVAMAPDYLYDSSAGLTTALKDKQEHRLPPAVQVTLVAMDESSAVRLSRSDLTSIAQKVNSLFSSESAKFDQQLKDLETYLTGLRVSYRTYSSVVNLNGSKQN